ncbi:hypothetical protein ACG873_03885 [Mesorhizobium sp. AaZ16]|uniref:hypothetical protein n=1 Tax=Mesorhizobium sp. AaZ16 TaxID=3402289 RepID=UPI00374EFD7A
MVPSIDYRLTAAEFESLGTENPELFVYAVGYEQRSSFARKFVRAKRSAAFLYGSRGRFSYDANLVAFEELGDAGLALDLSNVASTVTEAYVARGDGRIHVVLDVSCLNKSIIAGTLAILMELSQQVAKVSVVYVPGAFEEPALYMVPAQYFGPAIPQMAGNVGEPYKERCLIMGVGYEYGAALSAIEIIEPDRGFYFHPIGRSSKYEPAVRAANFNFDFGLGKYALQSYRVDDPVALHGRLRDVVESFLDRGTITIVPFGPKIFSSVASLLALRYPQHISLLRYSLASTETARDTQPDNYVVMYHINLAA